MALIALAIGSLVPIALGARAAHADSLTFTTVNTPDGATFLYNAYDVGDVNNDGYADVVGQTESSLWRSFGVMLGSADGSVAPVQTVLGVDLATAPFLLGDVNGDGNLDAVAQVCTGGRGNFGTCSGLRLAWFSGNGDGTFATTYGDLAGANGSPSARVTVGDVTGDGVADVLVPDNFFNTATGSVMRLRVFVGSSTGPVTTPIEFSLGAFDGHFGANVTVADVDGDGIGDAVIRSYDVTGALWRTRTLIGGPALGATSVPVEDSQNDGLGGGWSAVAGDLNGDGKADLVVPMGSAVYSLLSNGDGTFAGPVAIASSGSGSLVRLADLDQDSMVDLLVSGSGSLLFQRGNGDGTFGDAELLAAPAQSVYAVGDINGDGTTDVYFRASYQQSQSTVLLMAGGAADDGDGIAASIDGTWDGSSFTDESDVASAAFTDQHLGGTTYGSIVGTADLSVTVDDAAGPEGVLVTTGDGSGEVELSMCGIGSTFVAASSSVLVTCGSVEVTVVTGAARIEVGDDPTVVGIPAGATAKVSDLGGGTFFVENLGGGVITITDGGATSEIGDGETGWIDPTPPSVVVVGVTQDAVYTVGAVPTPSCDAADSEPGSGLLGPPTLTVTGGNPDGTGALTATCEAADVAGNTSSASVSYLVHYRIPGGGFQGPVNNPPVVNTGKAGRAYPLQWQVSDGSGEPLSDLNIVKSLKYRSTACGQFTGNPSDGLETETTGASGLRYDDGTNRFVYNWKTPRTPGCYQVFVLLSDTNVLTANFKLT